MRLTELKIENFRSFENETIWFDDYTCLVGPNGSGKSAVLMALNVFFRNDDSTVTSVLNLTKEDFHHKNTEQPIRITATFEDLCPAAQEDFKLYYRQKKLVVFAEAKWDAASESAVVKQHGSRLVMKDFAPFFEAEKQGKLLADLKPIYRGIKERYRELPNIATKTGMKQALTDYEETHLEKCELQDEPNEFYGFTKGEYRLEKYIQWVYVPAVKDASTEQDEGNKTALGRLLQRTVRTTVGFAEETEELESELKKNYEKMLDAQRGALNGLQLAIEKRLRDYADARARLQLKWHYDAKTAIVVRDPLARALIGDGEFIGEIARAGHGLQGAFLVALLHELVGNEKKGGPKLLLGFEEPELYQHPPQAQHLADVLERLATSEKNTQVIITTHSPYFVTSERFQNVRMVRKIRSGRMSKVTASDYQKMETRLSTALGEKAASATSLMARVSQIMHASQNELFFCGLAVLVEGQEDVGYIASQLAINNDVAEFRRLGCHFVLAEGKTNLSRLVAIAQELCIPFFVVFDGDGDEEDKEKRIRHEKDNRCILRLCGVSDADSLANKTLWEENVVMWASNIGDTVRADFGASTWPDAQNKVRERLGLQDGVKRKNRMLIAAALEQLSKEETVSRSLMKVCSRIVRFAQKVQL